MGPPSWPFGHYWRLWRAGMLWTTNLVYGYKGTDRTQGAHTMCRLPTAASHRCLSGHHALMHGGAWSLQPCSPHTHLGVPLLHRLSTFCSGVGRTPTPCSLHYAPIPVLLASCPVGTCIWVRTLGGIPKCPYGIRTGYWHIRIEYCSAAALSVCNSHDPPPK